MPDISYLEKLATQVRRDIIRMVHGAKSGHPGGSLGCADLMVALFQEVLDYDPSNFDMDGKGEDLFFLSIGHISPVYYSVMARSGYFDVSELATFRAIGSRLQGHPGTQEGLTGVRIAAGSLGQGLSVALGAALAKKLNHDDKLVYCLMGDGEIQEGQVWEAAMFGAGKNVDNIIGIIDYNGKQIDGPVTEVIGLDKLREKWEAFGWTVLQMNGNDMNEILQKMAVAKNNTGQGKPVIILMKTEMGQGVDFMMGTHKWHGNPPNDEQAEIALSQLEETLGDY